MNLVKVNYSSQLKLMINLTRTSYSIINNTNKLGHNFYEVVKIKICLSLRKNILTVKVYSYHIV